MMNHVSTDTMVADLFDIPIRELGKLFELRFEQGEKSKPKRQSEIVTRWRIQCAVCAYAMFWDEPAIDLRMDLRPVCSEVCLHRLPNPKRIIMTMRLEV